MVWDGGVHQTHYSTDGYVLSRSSDEAKRQMDLEKLENDAQAEFDRMINPPKDEKDGAPAPLSLASPPAASHVSLRDAPEQGLSCFV